MPIKNCGSAEERLSDDEYSVENTDSALSYLRAHCGLTVPLPGAAFEHHDELFDYAISHFSEPVHLLHVDAHADIAGGITNCWQYVLSEYTHLPTAIRKAPKRGDKFLNCGNFIVFLAGCGLLERVTFISHPKWRNDYHPLYMKNFDLASGALQLKRYSARAIKECPLSRIPHEVEPAVPFQRVPREEFFTDVAPDALFVTRSPGYTPASADSLYEALARYIVAASDAPA